MSIILLPKGEGRNSLTLFCLNIQQFVLTRKIQWSYVREVWLQFTYTQLCSLQVVNVLRASAQKSWSWRGRLRWGRRGFASRANESINSASGDVGVGRKQSGDWCLVFKNLREIKASRLRSTGSEDRGRKHRTEKHAKPESHTWSWAGLRILKRVNAGLKSDMWKLFGEHLSGKQN